MAASRAFVLSCNNQQLGACGPFGLQAVHVRKGSATLNHMGLEGPGPGIGGSGTCSGDAHDLGPL